MMCFTINTEVSSTWPAFWHDIQTDFDEIPLKNEYFL